LPAVGRLKAHVSVLTVSAELENCVIGRTTRRRARSASVA
jgi:hypothetical protein